MARYLIETTETYRVDSESEAAALIEAAKNDPYGVAKYSSTHKERKQKGEVVDEWYRVSLTRKFTEEKEPVEEVGIQYTNGGAF